MFEPCLNLCKLYVNRIEEESQNILKTIGLYNVQLKNKSAAGTEIVIEWMQRSRRLIGSCSEKYKECDYEKINDTQSESKIVKVFVAEKCGDPPESINTSGCTIKKEEEGKLHFEYLFKDDNSKIASVFFVIDPNSWGPYQHRFRTIGMLNYMEKGISK